KTISVDTPLLFWMSAYCHLINPAASHSTSSWPARGADRYFCLISSRPSSSEIQSDVGCPGAAMGPLPWLAQGPLRCSQRRSARLFHQPYHLRRRLLAGDNGEDVISPARQRPAPLGEIFRLVVGAGDASLMAHVGEHPLDDVRLNRQLVVHHGR